MNDNQTMVNGNNTRGNVAQLISGRITAKYDGRCCARKPDGTRCDAQFSKGETIWYARNASKYEQCRCVMCGPHPGAKTPSRFRPTKAEGLTINRQPRDPNAPQVDALNGADVAALNARIDVLAAQLANVNTTVRVEMSMQNVVRVVEGAHKALAKVLRVIACGIKNVYLVGPAGTGKTTLIEGIAKALGLNAFEQPLSGGVTETQLLGTILPQKDGGFAYEATAFVTAYTHGAAMLLDEMDGMDPNVGIALNMALANGKLVTRGGTFLRHETTIIVCAANTYGLGADAMYVGRNPLDAATLDRFVCAKVEVDYDRDVEKAIALTYAPKQADAFLGWAWGVRQSVQDARIRRVVSTRLIVHGAKLLGGGFALSEVREMFLQGWSQDERRKMGYA